MTLVSLTLLMGFAAQNQPVVTPEELMTSALKATELTFAKSESGLSFVVDFSHPDKLTQRVYVSTTSNAILSIRPHTIYTDVWSGKEPPSAEILEKALSTVKKMGHFYLYTDSKNTHSIRFGANFDASTLLAEPKKDDESVKALKNIIYFVDQVGFEASRNFQGK